MSPRIRIENEEDGRVLDVEAEVGELLSQASYRAGLPLRTTCGGKASCTDCKVIVKEGLKDGLEKPESLEIRAMGNVSHITLERLACQAQIKGDCAIFVPTPKKRK